MISYGILAQREAELRAKLVGGDELSQAERDDYYGLCILTIGMAVELYRYEYGHLPAVPEELVKLDYLDAWPGDPAHDWQPLSADFDSGAPGHDMWASVISLQRYENGAYELMNELHWDFSAPAATWLETEAKLHGQDYKAYEEHLSQTYADRMLWPASRVVVPPPAQPTAAAAK